MQYEDQTVCVVCLSGGGDALCGAGSAGNGSRSEIVEEDHRRGIAGEWMGED